MFFVKPAPSAHPYVSGNWYPASFGHTVNLSAGGALNTTTTKLMPMRVRRSVTITDLGVRITTLSASGNLRLGIYAADPVTGAPTGTSLGDVTVSTTNTGTVSATLSAAIQLDPSKLYWAALQADNTTAVCQAQATATAEASVALGDASLANTSSGATSGINYLVATKPYSGGMVDLTGVATTVSSGVTHALIWWKAA